MSFAGHGDDILVPDGACLFRPGDPSRVFLIVTSGTVRVEQTNAAGRTIVLYRVAAGSSCVLTTSGLLSGRPYSGYGYAEGPVQASSLPAERFRTLLSENAAFRDIVFKSVADRVGELTEVIDSLLLHRTDLRLARWLGRQPGDIVELTHPAIAQELGTAREVVSRGLKTFERKGWVRKGRGHIAILDAAALRRHSQSLTS